MLQATPNASFWPSPMPTPREIRALLLDDSTFDRARIRRLSDKTNLIIDMHEVDSLEKMNETVGQVQYDVVLIDYRLPVGDGLDALTILSDTPNNRTAGRVMITGDAASDTVVQAMRRGCHDFLHKEEMDALALQTAITTAMQAAWQSRQMEAFADTQKEIIRQGLIDAMKDRDVQGNVISLVKEHLGTPQHQPPEAERELDDLLAYLRTEDSFRFH